MEKACRVANGSNGHKVGRGYPLHGMIALGVESENLSPLALHIYSTFDEKFESEFPEHQKNFELLRPLIKNSAFDRIIVEDRGSDDEKRFLYFVNELETSKSKKN